MKRSTIWWLVGIATMILGMVLGVMSTISKELNYFMLIMGFLACINSNVLFIEEKM